MRALRRNHGLSNSLQNDDTMSTSKQVAKPERIGARLALCVLGLYLLDQVTKWYIVFHFTPPHELSNMVTDRVPVLVDNGLVHFDIIRIHNTGVAFGMANGEAWAPFVFFGVQVLALVGLCLLFRRGFFNTRLLKAAWVFVMAGVLGNMTDRLLQGFFIHGADCMSFWEKLTSGYVVDFLDFSFPWLVTEDFPLGYHWPSFNVADSCVCIATGLFIISAFFFETDSTAESSTDSPSV